MTPEFLRACLAGMTERAAALLALSLPASWPDSPSILQLRLEQLEGDPTLQPWLLRAMRRRSDGAMIGHIGFHTKPGPAYLKDWSPDAVEFGCTVFPDYRRRGFAREASLGLMRWAQKFSGVSEFVVSIGRENEASRALFAGLGFTRVGSHVDEIDGIEDVFVYRQAEA